MVMITWPIPYDHDANAFEVVGRYIAQTILMERFIDITLLYRGERPHDLKRFKLTKKIELIADLIADEQEALSAWSDLPDAMARVARNRNAFAHRMFERGAMPTHYGQGIPYEVLSDEELRQQERDAFMASEVCRQLAQRVTLASLNPGVTFGRQDPDWKEVRQRHSSLAGTKQVP